MPPRPRLLALALALAAVGLSGCSPDDEPGGSPGGGTAVADRLTELPGVAGARESTERIEQDGPEVTEIVVDLEPDPEVEELAPVLEVLADAGTGRTAAYVDAQDAPYLTSYRSGLSGIRSLGEGDDPRATAELFVAALGLLEVTGDDASVDVDLDPVLSQGGPPPVVTVVVPDATPADVEGVERAAADDPFLADVNLAVFPE